MTSQVLDYSGKTKACLVDRLKQHLASIESEEEEKYGNRKYYNLKYYNLLKIGAFKPVLYFIIYLSDLSPKLRSLYSRDCGFVLKQTIGRIFEDVNFEGYRNSVSSSKGEVAVMSDNIEDFEVKKMKEALSSQVYGPDLKRVKDSTIALVLPMDQDTTHEPDIKHIISETSGCSAYSKLEVDIPIDDLGKINLLCENCKPKFSDSKSWVSKI